MASEIEYSGLIKRGDKGFAVKRVQEWLTLHGNVVKIDSEFGPGTESAVKQFQAARGLEPDGKVGPLTFDRLTAPLRAALAPIPANGRTLGGMTAAWAHQLVAVTPPPRETKLNEGPWVRLVMGWEGPKALWCAGFASFCLKKAAAALHVQLPFQTSEGCDELAANAKKAGCFLESPGPDARAKITPGSFFLVRAAPGDWTHTGIVASVEPEVFHTIEGNASEGGSRNGDGVYARTRTFGPGYDFILIP